MATKPPINPAVFDARIRVAETQVEQLQREREACLARLAEVPDDTEVHGTIDRIDADLSAAQATHKRLQDARSAAEAQFGSEARAAYLAQLEADRAEVEALGEQMRQTAEDIAAHAARLGPMLQRFNDHGERRSALVSGILRAGSTNRQVRARFGGYSESAAMRRGPLSVLVEATLGRVGVGRLAPLCEVVVPQPPAMPGLDGWAGAPGQRYRREPDRSQDWRMPEADYTALSRAWFEREAIGLSMVMREAIGLAAEG
jgi:hypothetical protein